MSATPIPSPDPVEVAEAMNDFRRTFRAFFAAYNRAADAGVELPALLTALQEEGVELPEWVGMLL